MPKANELVRKRSHIDDVYRSNRIHFVAGLPDFD
jgi:hypothetical protein